MTTTTTKEAAVAMTCFWMIGSTRSRTGFGLGRAAIETKCWRRNFHRALSRPRYGRRKPVRTRRAPSVVGVRHGHRERTLTGTFGKTRIVPRAQLTGEDDGRREWRRFAARRQRRDPGPPTPLIAGAYLAGTNTRRVRRALNAVLAEAGRQGRGQPRLAQDEGRLGRLECAFARRRADRAADPRRHSRARPGSTKGDLGICSWGALGVRADGRRCCSRSRAWAGKARRPGVRCSTISSARIANAGAGRHRRRAGPRKGGGGAVARRLGCQRCTVHKHRNLLAHAPERACTGKSRTTTATPSLRRDAQRGQTRRKAFIRKYGSLKCCAVADSLEEAGDRLFTFTRFPPSQWKSIRTSNARSSDC